MARNVANDIALMRGSGDGTFTPMGSFAAGARAPVARFGDMNRAGKLDVVASSQDGAAMSVLIDTSQ